MRLIFVLFLFFSLNTHAGGENRIEMYIYNGRTIPIEHLLSTESFYMIWYNLAKKEKPLGVPILTPFDVVNFDTLNFELTVSEEGWSHFTAFEIPAKGIPIIIVVDGKVAYGAWLWNSTSSLSCPGVSYHFSKSNTERKLTIQQGVNSPEIRIPQSLRQKL